MASPRVSSSEPDGRGAALAIGNFDGVHRGHQALVAFMLELAIEDELKPTVMTFEPHPAVVLGGTPPPLLTRLERKIELLQACGPKLEVIVQPFDREFAQLSPAEFVERVLVKHVHTKQLVVGANFRFGRGRAGNVDQLRELGKSLGFVAHGFELSGDTLGSFSSSRIRDLLRAGDVTTAAALLGRPHSISGIVVRGDGRGRSIGCPTANLDEVSEVRPADGVYAARALEIDEAGAHPIGSAVVHLGPRPTVDRGETIEAHILDTSLDLYGRTLRVEFLGRLRGLERFGDIDALKRQIERDIKDARPIIETSPY